MDNRNEDVYSTILKHVGVITEYQTGWRKEVNIVAWNDLPPKVDIRDWSPDHERMSRGITLHIEEGMKLYEVLKGEFENVK